MRVIEKQLRIGGINRAEILNRIFSLPLFTDQVSVIEFVSGVIPLDTEVVKLVGVRNFELGIDGFTTAETLYPIAQKLGLRICPDYLPFQLAIKRGGIINETFIFSVIPRWIPYWLNPNHDARCLLSTHSNRGLGCVLDQPYGGGVEFVFIQK